MGYEENNLPRSQAAMGHEVVLLTSSSWPREFRRAAFVPGRMGEAETACSTVSPPKVAVHRLHSTPEVNGQLVFLDLHSKLRRLEPEIVHCHGAFSLNSVQCLYYRRTLGYSLFVDDHSHSRNLVIDSRAKRLYTRTLRRIYQSRLNDVSAFVAVTPAAAIVLESQLGIPKSRLFQSQLGADTGLFHNSQNEREDFRERMGLDDDDLLVLTTGKFRQSKDIDVLIKSFALVPDNRPFTLLIAGTASPHLMAHFRALARGMRERRILFHDLVPHSRLSSYYNGADIGVWPGAHTISAIEALATGLPSILPREEVGYKLIHENQACMPFDRRLGPQGLAESITTLATRRDLMRKFSQNAMALVERELSWSVIAERLLSLYNGSALV
jgi:glycosyltransferase involved in cell wall biosynthesis